MRVVTPPLLPFALHRPEATNPRIIEDLLEVADANALTAIIDMLADLHQHGRESRYAKKLEGWILWEPKTRSRGGPKDSARVYFSFTHHGEALAITLAYANGRVRLLGGTR